MSYFFYSFVINLCLQILNICLEVGLPSYEQLNVLENYVTYRILNSWDNVIVI